MGKKERVILIKGDESKWYEQAIFIVNQNTPQDKIPKDFVAEAEKIIHNHVHKKYNKQNNVGIAYASAPAATAVPAQHTLQKKAAINNKMNNKKKNKQFDYILNTVMAIGCFVIAAVIMWGLFG